MSIRRLRRDTACRVLTRFTSFGRENMPCPYKEILPPARTTRRGYLFQSRKRPVCQWPRIGPAIGSVFGRDVSRPYEGTYFETLPFLLAPSESGIRVQAQYQLEPGNMGSPFAFGELLLFPEREVTKRNCRHLNAHRGLMRLGKRMT